MTDVDKIRDAFNRGYEKGAREERERIKSGLEEIMGWQVGEWYHPDMLISFLCGRWQSFWQSLNQATVDRNKGE